jgi:hypothetical protein
VLLDTAALNEIGGVTVVEVIVGGVVVVVVVEGNGDGVMFVFKDAIYELKKKNFFFFF